MIHIINDSNTKQSLSTQKIFNSNIKTNKETNIFDQKTRLNLHQKHDNNEKTSLSSRKQTIQNNQAAYLKKQHNREHITSTDNSVMHFPAIRHIDYQENQTSSINQKLEHTPFIFQSLISKSIASIQNKQNQHNKEQKRRKSKNNKKIIITKYWDNKSPLFVLGKNAEILKKGLRKGKSNTKILLPEKIKKILTGKFTNHHLLDPEYWSRTVEHWLSLNKSNRQASIESLLQHTIIANTDLRKKLHGQSGVLAAREIPPYFVIAPYSGLYCIGSDILKEKACHGTNVGRYAVDCSLNNLQIDLCGYGYGNITLCINANTTYSKNDPAMEDNTCFALITYQGWPYIFVISISKIKKSSELLIDYGQNYWTLNQ